MRESQHGECLELYKLHAQLADRVSQRHEGANRLYASLVTALAAFVGALFKFGTDEFHDANALFFVGSMCVLLFVKWHFAIRSYRQLNTGKFQALHELEEHLVFPFYSREWQLLGESEHKKTYLQVTRVEQHLPWAYGLMFLALTIGAWFL